MPWKTAISKCVSATPGPYEAEHELLRAEQIIRPTGLLDPPISIHPVEGQIDDLISEINRETEKGNKVLVTTLTKKMAEDLTDYMKNIGIRVRYLHSDVDTLERSQIIRDMRMNVFDVLVGINLLLEGLDIPEVSLVAMGVMGTEEAPEDELCASYIRSLLTGDCAFDIDGRIRYLQDHGGAKFFDPAQQEVYPEMDYWMSTDRDRFGFVLRAEREGNHFRMKKICVEGAGR